MGRTSKKRRLQKEDRPPPAAAPAPVAARLPCTDNEGDDHPSDLFSDESDVSLAENNHHAFCCYICRCKNETVLSRLSSQTNSQDDGYYHRHCCHKIHAQKVGATWKPEIERCFDTVASMMTWDSDDESSSDHDGNNKRDWIEDLKEEEANAKKEEVNAVQLVKSGKKSGRQATTFETDDSKADPISVLYSHPNYERLSMAYHRECENRRPAGNRPKANVLDLFCGVGTGLVVLKRLGVSINQYHFLDHDKTARHVFKYNHCADYERTARPDLIHYVEYGDFEEVEQHLDRLLSRQPIDIIIGGPPCQDFSRVNARRQGIRGKNDIFLTRTMNIIKSIQNHPKQGGRPVFAMVENVAFTEFTDIQVTEEAFECAPVELDAQYFSPCRRNRHYWVNFPIDNYNFRGQDSKSTPCLEDGWTMIGDALNDNFGFSKSNTFMASKGRLDDHPRMSKVKQEGDRFLRGSYSLREREWMMGLPEDYVQKPVAQLYRELLEALGARSLKHNTWQNALDEKYWDFSGAKYFKYSVAGIKSDAEVIMQMAPQTPEVANHLTEEECGKRLIGNAFSVPVVEHLLRPLTKLFAHRYYYGYNSHRVGGQADQRPHAFKWRQTQIHESDESDEQSLPGSQD